MRNDRRRFLLLVFLFLLPLAVDFPVLRGGFAFDDLHSISRNPHIRGIENIPRFFTDPACFSGIPRNAMYRPFLLVTYSLDYAIAGLSPWFWHLTNLLLHGAAGVLVWLPRALTERELDALRECTACRELLAAERAHPSDDERAALTRLEEEEGRLGGQVREVVRAAYYEGVVLSAFGEVLSGPELARHRGDWLGAVTAAAGWSLERIFPGFASIAPSRVWPTSSRP